MSFHRRYQALRATGHKKHTDVSIDLSNYWTANLYFKARNGTYKRVPQMANQFNDGDNAGITIYYTSPAVNATTAFKPVGLNPSCRVFLLKPSSSSRAFACLPATQ